MPRMPHHAITTPPCHVGGIIGRGGWKPVRAMRIRTATLNAITHATRTTMTVASTAPANSA